MASIRNCRNERWVGAIHLFGISGLALAQPLYDLMAQFPEFLVAHQLNPGDILLLAATLTFGIPFFAVGLLQVLAGAGSRAYRLAHRFALAAFVAALFLQIFKRIPALGASGVLLASSLCALAAVLTYGHWSAVRTFLTYLGPIALVFPFLFLFQSPVRKLVFSQSSGQESYGVPETPTSIVLVVFDELPLISLLDEHNQIDPVRFPNLVALAKGSYWFRNATSPSDSTVLAVPALVDGILPREGRNRLPTLADRPDNLFTLFAKSHELNVHENITRLSPARSSVEPGFFRRQSLLLSDLGFVYLQVLLPEEWSSHLPRVTESWRGFGVSPDQEGSPSSSSSPPGGQTWADFEKADWAQRDERFREFVDSIRVGPRPGLHFLHSMLPHASWRFLPDGRRYSLTEPPGVRGVIGPNDRGEDPNRWLPDEWLPLQAYQRHLLQVGFVDTLVGELVKHLKTIGLFDSCLLVVTADHGASFLPGDSRRDLTPTNYPAILSVPLFIKAPNQVDGVVSDRNVLLTDVLPTITQLLGFRVPWEIDGTSAVDPSSPEPVQKFACSPRGEFMFEKEWALREELLKSKLQSFGSGDWASLFQLASVPELMDTLPAQWPVRDADEVDVEMDGLNFLAEARPDSKFLLANISGRVLSRRPSHPPRNLALALNGVIRAVTRTSSFVDSGREFSALLDPSLIRPGLNSLEIYLVEIRRDGIELLRSRSRTERFSLVRSSDDQDSLQSSLRKAIAMGDPAVQGWVVAGFEEDGGRVWVGGWVVDTQERGQVDSVVLFRNGKFILSGPTRFKTMEAVRQFNDPTLEEVGFRFSFSLTEAEAATSEFRVFAVSRRGTANELHYPLLDDAVNWPFLRPRSDYVVTGTYSPRGEMILSPGRKAIEVKPGAVVGGAFAEIEAGLARISGWATGPDGTEPVSGVAVFRDGELLVAGPAAIDPPRGPGFPGGLPRRSGFLLSFPFEEPDRKATVVRVFAFAREGLAGELEYPAADSSRPWPFLVSRSHELRRCSEGEVIGTSDGDSFPLESGPSRPLEGWVIASYEGDPGRYWLRGWVTDGREPVRSVVAFQDGRFSVEVPALPDSRQSTGPPTESSLDRQPFQFYLDLPYEQAARTSVRVFAISRRGFAAELQYPSLSSSETWPFLRAPLGYLLQGREEGSEQLVSAHGMIHNIASEKILGWTVGGIDPGGQTAWVGGWVVESSGPDLVETVLVFADGEMVAGGPSLLERPEAVERFGNPNLLRSGFHFAFRVGNKPSSATKVRVFAISEKGVAGELFYPDRSAAAQWWPFSSND